MSVRESSGCPRPPTSHALPAVELRSISKRFGRVDACKEVDLVVSRGEIHGLLGQNGAGKSTVAKILIGLYTPDSGEVRVDDERVVIRDLSDAVRCGIGMVHQHFSLIDPMAVWENVGLGDPHRPDRDRLCAEIREIGTRYGLDIDPEARVADLAVGQRQRVEILKCLRRNPQTLILDEPTSSLTRAESRDLFDVLRRVVQDEGRAVVLISHKLEEIMHATDRVTIMRAGNVVARVETAATNPQELAREMVGREVSLRVEGAVLGMTPDDSAVVQDDATQPARRVMLRIRDASSSDPEGRVLLDRLSLEVHEGEILGLAGVEGNGQHALGDALASILRLSSGSVEVDGRPVATGRPGAMTRAGIGIITEDRHRSGCVLSMSVTENLVLGQLRHLSGRGGFLNTRRLRDRARELMREFDISAASADAPMWTLSGGNQQRVVLARELSSRPKVLVAAQPTVGLDVGAIEYMSERLRATADAGVGVLLISTELEEILALSDRVAVIHAGRIVGVERRDRLDAEKLGLMMGGQAA